MSKSHPVIIIWSDSCAYVYPTNRLSKSCYDFCFISLIAYVFGAINEKKAGDSILPSVFIHTFANTAAGLCLAISLL